VAAVLSGADLPAAQMQSADLSRAKLGCSSNYSQGEKLSTASACLSGADLSGANLYMAQLGRVDCSKARLVGANIDTSDFLGANLYAADLTGVCSHQHRGQGIFNCANFTNAIMTLNSSTVATKGAVGLPTPVDGVFSRTSRVQVPDPENPPDSDSEL